MRKTKSQKGITLIALIITIIVLLILAVVAIGAVQNDGVINHAKNARDEYEKAGANENTTLEGYLDKIEDNLPVTMEDAMKPKMLTKKANSDVIDKYGNKITVPAGFKIIVDKTTGYTEETIDATKGIVIEDAQGNQFVWIPVGNVYYSETEYKTITLGRYVNFTANSKGEYIPSQTATDYATATLIGEYYTEHTKSNHDKEVYKNAIAEDIGAFVTSAIKKGGYYLARYEAGVINYDSSKSATNSGEEINWTGYVAEEGKELQLVSKENVQPWNNVTQSKASELSKNMYTSNNFKSDLINSYAWDTAIVFIQTFSTESDASKYADLNKSKTFANTGINTDKYCNIYDMSGNTIEWSTETYRDASNFCVRRGGWYSNYTGFPSSAGTGYRDGVIETISHSTISFRPLLYVAL